FQASRSIQEKIMKLAKSYSRPPLGQSGHQSADWPKSLQAAHEAKGQLEQMDANRPVWPKRGTSAQGQLGSRDVRDAESQFGRRRRKLTNCLEQMYTKDANRP
ncbi:hypothetical protein KI387_028086, partial [Taxus chinensis]